MTCDPRARGAVFAIAAMLYQFIVASAFAQSPIPPCQGSGFIVGGPYSDVADSRVIIRAGSACRLRITGAPFESLRVQTEPSQGSVEVMTDGYVYRARPGGARSDFFQLSGYVGTSQRFIAVRVSITPGTTPSTAPTIPGSGVASAPAVVTCYGSGWRVNVNAPNAVARLNVLRDSSCVRMLTGSTRREFRVESGPHSGRVDLLPTGYRYTPNPGFVGADDFTLTWRISSGGPQPYEYQVRGRIRVTVVSDPSRLPIDR